MAIDEKMRRNIPLLYTLVVLNSANIFAPFLTPFLLSSQFTLGEAVKLTGITALASCFAELPTGWLADTRGYRRSFLLAAAVCSAGYGAYALTSRWHIMAGVGAFVAGIGASFVRGADHSFARQSHAARDQVKNYGSVEVWLVRLAGASEALAVSGGAQLAHHGYGTVLWAQSLLSALMVVPVLFMTEPPLASGRMRGTAKEFYATLSGLRQNPHLLWVNVFAASISLTTALTVWLTAPYIATALKFQLNPKEFSWELGRWWVAYLFSVFLFGYFVEEARKRFGVHNVFAGLVVVALLAYFVIGWRATLAGVLAMFALYAVRTFQLALVPQYINALSKDGERATMQSVRRVVQWAMYFAATQMYDAFLGRQPAEYTIGIVGGCCVAMSIISLCGVLRYGEPALLRSEKGVACPI